MGGRGPVPKETRSRSRDSVEPDAVEITGEMYGRPLPEGILPNDEQWHPQTLALWEAFRVWPVMADLPEVSWQFLIDTMLQHHVMWTKGKWEFAAELRLRVAKYGVTPEDRMRLKIKLEIPAVTAPAKAAGNVRDIASRRTRLSG